MGGPDKLSLFVLAMTTTDLTFRDCHGNFCSSVGDGISDQGNPFGEVREVERVVEVEKVVCHGLHRHDREASFRGGITNNLTLLMGDSRFRLTSSFTYPRVATCKLWVPILAPMSRNIEFGNSSRDLLMASEMSNSQLPLDRRWFEIKSVPGI